jgi:GTP cyclohydrolase I
MTQNPSDRDAESLVDIQSTEDDRGIPLRQVGIKALRYPLVVWDRDERRQSTVGTFKMTVDLPRSYKGTHMSRFITALEKYNGDISLETLPHLVEDLRHRLDAETAHVRVEFPYFIRREAPVSGEASRLEVSAWFVGEAGERDAKFVLGVDVPVMTLCPCSRAISDYGAHCQRSHVRISIRFRELVWIEELVAYADASASAPIFPLLKREDEKWVTEHSYDHPVFVEDLVRNVATRLRDDHRLEWFYVEAENEESIHAHNAYAAVYSTDLDDRG